MDMPPPAPPAVEVEACLEAASDRYGIPEDLMHAVLKIEGGDHGVVAKNNNGTEDLGWAQINTWWLPKLEKYGIGREDLLYDPCVNIGVGAWIMRNNYDRHQDWTKAIASYNAGSKIEIGMPYARKVISAWSARTGQEEG